MQLAKQLGEIAIAWLVRRRLEGATQRGRNTGMSWRKVDTDYPAIHAEFRRYTMLAIGIH